MEEYRRYQLEFRAWEKENVVRQRTHAWASTKALPKVKRFFQTRTLSMEVINEDRELEQVHFPKLPVCDHLSKSVREQFKWDVNRDSTHAKVAEFFQCFPSMLESMQHEAKQSHNKLLKCLAKSLPAAHQIKFILILLANVLMMLVVQPDVDDPFENEMNHPFTYKDMSDENHNLYLPGPTRELLFKAVCAVLLLVIAFIVIVTIFSEADLIVSTKWLQKQQAEKNEKELNDHDDIGGCCRRCCRK